jgi:sulfite exporter TauE/SafE
MTAPDGLTALVTAFMAGLLGSGHCFGMCGGIAASLGALGSGGSGRSRPWPALVFNSGRLVAYVVLGVLAAMLLGNIGDMLHIPRWARMLRLLMAVIILLIGLRFLFDLRLLDPLEKAGARLWQRVQPFAVRVSSRPGAVNRLLLGLCWGLVPCGLVYSVVLMAASTASVAGGASLMLAFGIGTLPSMLGSTWMSPIFSVLLRDRWVRRLVGFSLVLLAGWTLVMLFSHQ